MGTFSKLSYHLVFGTKFRRRTITESIRERLYEYTGGIVRNVNGAMIEIGGIEDHVHMLINLTPARAVADIVRDLKSNSAKWMNELPEVRDRFEWQKGYSVFTVSYSQVDPVRTYIRNQKEHHRTITFKEEYIEFLKRHDVEFKPEYLFEQEHHA